MRFLRRHPVALALSLVFAVGLAAIGFSAVVVWREAHHDDASDFAQADVIVVLGAAQYDGTPSPVFAGRLDHAALLYEQGRAGVVLVLGGNQPGDRATEADAGRDYLVANGLPATSVMALPEGDTSYTSLRAAAREMRALDLRSAFLVSDPWHNARIQSMAGDLGIDAHASATWTSAARSEETRIPGYVRETFAYLHYLVVGN